MSLRFLFDHEDLVRLADADYDDAPHVLRLTLESPELEDDDLLQIVGSKGVLSFFASQFLGEGALTSMEKA